VCIYLRFDSISISFYEHFPGGRTSIVFINVRYANKFHTIKLFVNVISVRHGFVKNDYYFLRNTRIEESNQLYESGITYFVVVVLPIIFGDLFHVSLNK